MKERSRYGPAALQERAHADEKAYERAKGTSTRAAFSRGHSTGLRVLDRDAVGLWLDRPGDGKVDLAAAQASVESQLGDRASRTGHGQDILEHGIEILVRPRDNSAQEIARSADRVNFEDFGDRGQMIDDRAVLALSDLERDERQHTETDGRGVDIRAVAGDHTGRLETVDASLGRTPRDRCQTGEFGDWRARPVAKNSEDRSVDVIEAGHVDHYVTRSANNGVQIVYLGSQQLH